MTIPLDQITSMPAYSPYFPPPPARYRNVRFQYVCFRADTAAVDRLLPACFEPAADGFCAAIGLTVPWSANYGAFDESVLVVKCLFEGRVGYFAPVVFLNSRSSIPAGREIYGTPKVYADLEVRMEERVMVTDTFVGGGNALSIRSTMHSEAAPEEFPDLSPSWRLKAIPRADGSGCDVLQLIDGGRGEPGRDRPRPPQGGRRRTLRAGAGVRPVRAGAAGILRGLLRRAGLHRRVRRDRARLPRLRRLRTEAYSNSSKKVTSAPKLSIAANLVPT